MKTYLQKLINKENLSREEMKAAASHCFTSEVTESEIAAFLIALQAKGETADEITGLAEVIREKSSFQTENTLNVIDNCGTGGDRSNSFNISTTAAFVMAGAGIKIAKHGNRSISSKTGSADVLEHLGVSLSFSKEHIEEMLAENNIAFLFAPHVHEVLKPFSVVRQHLGVPTIFNVIGPLTNPIQLETQLVGVYRKDLLEKVAESLNKLGRRRAVVVTGAGSLDEASLAGLNKLIVIEDGKLTPMNLHPEEVNLPIYPNEAIRGGDSKRNAEILLSVLKGEPGAYFDTVLLNAGIGIYTSRKTDSIQAGIELARESILSGAALERLERLVSFSEKIPV
ncbi:MULTISPECIES: anthranilate phosphoribosyltransferase [unclassified Oceanobacillus]|uniref:anthranilate phosphoribosyltransferase n=1 Tax=unclassified Oceanobacillus TaxID=2630292 RepID=UPI00300DBF00